MSQTILLEAEYAKIAANLSKHGAEKKMISLMLELKCRAADREEGDRRRVARHIAEKKIVSLMLEAKYRATDKEEGDRRRALSQF